ncbi:glycosyltransferase family 4 protein [bacterium SCSIO 12741]|nr:glycosyltransferase family 4 protein [bacterium SCSIO 12741]
MAKAFREQGKKSSLVYYGVEPLEKSFQKFCEDESLEFSYVHHQGRGSMASWKDYLKSLKEQSPDVILLHSLNLTIPTIYYSLLNRCPFISVEHTGGLKSWPDKLSSILALIFSAITVILEPNYRQSTWPATQGLFRKKDRVIQNGVDLMIYKPASKQRPVLISMAGRLNYPKDYVTPLNMALDILDENSDIQAEIQIAGTGEHLKQLDNIIKERGEGRAKLLGYLNEEDLADLLARSQVFVMKSDAENMPTVLLQAMASECAVVASDIPNIRRLMPSDYPGLFDNRDPEDLKRRLEHALRSSSENESRVELRHHVDKLYNIAQMIEEYTRLIELQISSN